MACFSKETISKLFKHSILSCISPFIASTDNQYGVRSHHGTEMCVFLLKQIVSYYVNKCTQRSQHLWMHLTRLAELTTTYCIEN